MKLQIVTASRGALWVRQGFQIFFRRPLAFAGMFGLFSLAVLLVSLVPFAGAVLSFGAMPLMSLGFMVATHQALQGSVPGPSAFWLPLRGDVVRKRNLLKMGLVYALCIVTLLALWYWLDGGRINSYRATLTNPNPTPEAMNAMATDGRLLISLFSPMLLVGLLSLPFWHAPALVHWGGLPVGKALFFSTVACWRNRGAFFIYGLAWAGVLLVFVMLSTLMLALIGMQQAAMLAAMPAALLLSTVFYTSLFFTFADCFEMPSAAPIDTTEPAP